MDTTKPITVNGIRMHYSDQGEGLPIVLLHGFCGSSAYWTRVIPELRQSYRVITPDLRGHGGTDAPNEPYSIELMASDIAELLHGLGIRKAVLFGHSLGGYVTLAFAERHADLLAGFALVHSTAYPDDEKGKENRVKAIFNIRENGIRPFIDGLVPKLFAPGHSETMPEWVQLARRIGYETKPEGAIHTAQAMKERPDRRHVLEATDLPVMLVAGASDQIIPAEKTFSVHKPNIREVTLDGAGHMSMLENPGALIEAMNRFLKPIPIPD